MPQSFAVYLLVSPHFFDGVVQDVRVNLNALVPFELGGLAGHLLASGSWIFDKSFFVFGLDRNGDCPIRSTLRKV